MTKAELFEKMIDVPDDMNIVIDLMDGTLAEPCFSLSTVRDVENPEGHSERVFVVSPCFCGIEDELEIWEEGVPIINESEETLN